MFSPPTGVYLYRKCSTSSATSLLLVSCHCALKTRRDRHEILLKATSTTFSASHMPSVARQSHGTDHLAEYAECFFSAIQQPPYFVFMGTTTKGTRAVDRQHRTFFARSLPRSLLQLALYSRLGPFALCFPGNYFHSRGRTARMCFERNNRPSHTY